jgi:hypothetical protein
MPVWSIKRSSHAYLGEFLDVENKSLIDGNAQKGVVSASQTLDHQAMDGKLFCSRPAMPRGQAPRVASAGLRTGVLRTEQQNLEASEPHPPSSSSRICSTVHLPPHLCPIISRLTAPKNLLEGLSRVPESGHTVMRKD